MIKLYPDQQELKDRTVAMLQVAKDVAMVLPTGGGKTAIFTSILKDFDGYAVAIAHRQEIVTQMSLALARNGVRHQVIASDNVIKLCRRLHLRELNANYVEPNARTIVAGVDTLLRRNEKWFSRVGLVVNDECHHLLRDNKWGIVRDKFVNAVGLGTTATPCRADAKGLGRWADGFIDVLVEGCTYKQLLSMGRLSQYRVACPLVDVDVSAVPIGANGDYSQKVLGGVFAQKSSIVGDIADSYLKLANGKRGITFSVNVEEATKQAKAYRDRGVPAEVVTADTDDALRDRYLRMLANGELLQLVNVDLFGEGVDVPAVETVSMARPTESYSLYAQQFGRPMRKAEGKEFGLIIDHVGNVLRHRPPDMRNWEWTLDKRESRAKSTKRKVPMRVCNACLTPREAYLKACPQCGYEPEPVGRSTPEQVDGDLSLLTPEALAALMGEVSELDKPLELPDFYDWKQRAGVKKSRMLKLSRRDAMREAIASWAGRQSQDDCPLVISELQRKFYLTFGVDVLSAQLLEGAAHDNLIKNLG